MNPIKNFLNNILEMKSNKHNLNQGNKFLNNKNKFMVFSKNIENYTGMELTCEQLFEKVLYPPNNQDNTFKYNNGTDKKRTELVCSNKKYMEKNIAFLENNYIPYFQEKIIEKQKELDANLPEPKNVKDAKGNIYYLNSNNQYYLYEDSTGESSFLPNHVDFPITCPKDQPTFTNIPSYVNGNVDFTDDNKCKQYNNTEINNLIAGQEEQKRKLRELKLEAKLEGGETNDDYKRNIKSIQISHAFNKYNDLVKKSKGITDDIKAFDTSRDDFLKSISILQIQYGAIGLTSLIFIYLMIKMMSKN
jgi:hypothetical protein